jgi:hypothetical protein
MNALAVKVPADLYAHSKVLASAVVRKIAVAQSAARMERIVVQLHPICGPVFIAHDSLTRK